MVGAMEPVIAAHSMSRSSHKKNVPDLAGLENRLGYSFQQPDLLVQALTHSSAVQGQAAKLKTYERLEFLGDRVLGLVVADMLMLAFPKADEGELSRRFTQLVRHETCASVAMQQMDLGAYLLMGEGESQSGGRRKLAILGDACEAIIGAVFTEGGFDAAAALVRRLWTGRMMTPITHLRDPKTALQEWVQSKGLPAPMYHEVARRGPDHEPEFVMLVDVATIGSAEGAGRSKRLAEQTAAKILLVSKGVWEEEAHGH